ncbi:MAG TPA: LysR family transcriptional regulator [Xanthobacteraceae bacterium]|nr:LysR family transcriptional regulator [Xanthobacteraceae bacterium]
MAASLLPSPRQVRIFAAVAAAQSISGAARAINLSQPGVTQAIRALERRVDAALFDRRGSGCYLTPAGSILAARIERFVERLRFAVSESAGPAHGGAPAPDVVINRITAAQIRGLIAASEHGSFAAAARSLNISEPSLHRAAKSLERELRRRLYQRTSQGMTATPQGKEIARRFQVALRELGYGIEELQAARGNVVTRIVIGNVPHSGTQVLSAAIEAFLNAYPTATVEIVDDHYEALLDRLRAGKIDLLYGVLRRPAWAADVVEETLFTNTYVVVGRARHPLRRARQLDLRDLARYDWIMPGPMTPRRQAFRQIFAGLSAPPRISVETTSLQIYRDLLSATDRLTLMSALEARLNDRKQLAALPFKSPTLRRADGLARRRDWHPTDIHRHFLKVLRAKARGLQLVRGKT